mgnify:CR=1 FL=1
MKAAELRDLSVEDLKEKIVEESKALNTLVLNHAVSPIENPLQIRETRRIISRILTRMATNKKQNK